MKGCRAGSISSRQAPTRGGSGLAALPNNRVSCQGWGKGWAQFCQSNCGTCQLLQSLPRCTRSLPAEPNLLADARIPLCKCPARQRRQTSHSSWQVHGTRWEPSRATRAKTKSSRLRKGWHQHQPRESVKRYKRLSGSEEGKGTAPGPPAQS